MPYFIVFKSTSGEEVVKMVKDRGRLHEAVDEGIKGSYLADPIVKAYHSNNLVMVNTDKRVAYNGR